MSDKIVQYESSMPDIANLRSLAKEFLDSKMFPGIHSVAGFVTVIQAGFELGFQPVQSLQCMSIVKGRLCLEAKALLAVANQRAGVTWEIVKLDATECTMIFKRPDFEDMRVSFTEEDARRAGLANKDNYKNWPEDMNFARCSSRGVRRIAPDAILSAPYSAEEMEDAPDLNETKPKKTKKEKEKDNKWTEKNPLETDELPEGLMSQSELEDAEKVTAPEKERTPAELKDPSEDLQEQKKEAIIKQIKDWLNVGNHDERKFKEWLWEYQRAKNRRYVGKIGKAFRFHMGVVDDLELLFGSMTAAIAEFYKATQPETEENDEF